MIARSVFILLMIAAWSAADAYAQDQAETIPPLLRLDIVESNKDGRLIALNAGRRAGISLHDPVWFDLGPAGWQVGSIFFLTDEQSVCRLTDTARSEPLADAPALLFRNNSLQILRPLLPERVTITGQVTACPPGRRTAWINLGAQDGLQLGDTLMIYRKGVPISRGQLALCEKQLSLMTCRPLVSNALPGLGDEVRLWPRPGEQAMGRTNSSVLGLQKEGNSTLITLVGSAADGLRNERTIDLFRGRRYVGAAVLTEVQAPLSKAQIIESASAMDAQVGDQVIIRPPAKSPAQPLTAAVFRIEPDGYCMIAAGEKDGVQRGEKFVIRHQDPADPTLWRDIAELSITKVNIDYAAGFVGPLDNNSPPVERWDLADRLTPSPPQYLPAGIVVEVNPELRTAEADIDPQIEFIPGEVVRWIPTRRQESEKDVQPAAAVVTAVHRDRVALYMPASWGPLDRLLQARIDKIERIGGTDRLHKRRAPGRPLPTTRPQEP